MKKILIHTHQSVSDVAIQFTGTVAGLFDVALANDIGITDQLNAGDTLIIGEVYDEQITNYFYSRGITPANEDRPLILKSEQKLFENGLFANGLFE